MKKTIAERFWIRVNIKPGDECWTWNGPRRGKGYGQFGRNQSAHRVSWEVNRGPIPVGLGVLHRCDNPGCVRPDHLFLGTQADNALDRTLKHRHPLAKVTPEAAADMISMKAAGGRSVDIANALGVNFTTVDRVIRGEHWTVSGGSHRTAERRRRDADRQRLCRARARAPM